MNRFFLLLPLIMFVSCGDENEIDAKDLKLNKGEVVSKYSKTDELIKQVKKDAESVNLIEEKKENDVSQLPKTTLEFDKTEHDYGKVKAGEEYFTEFTVKNTGDNPLVISNVKGSCGCTTPQKPESPIEPGKSDVIKVGFKPKESPVEQSQTVTVQSNTEDSPFILKIKATVKPQK